MVDQMYPFESQIRVRIASTLIHIEHTVPKHTCALDFKLSAFHFSLAPEYTHDGDDTSPVPSSPSASSLGGFIFWLRAEYGWLLLLCCTTVQCSRGKIAAHPPVQLPQLQFNLTHFFADGLCSQSCMFWIQRLPL